MVAKRSNKLKETMVIWKNIYTYFIVHLQKCIDRPFFWYFGSLNPESNRFSTIKNLRFFPPFFKAVFVYSIFLVKRNHFRRVNRFRGKFFFCWKRRNFDFTFEHDSLSSIYTRGWIQNNRARNIFLFHGRT